MPQPCRTVRRMLENFLADFADPFPELAWETGLVRLLMAGGGSEQIAEVEVTSTEAAGKTLSALPLHGCLAVALRRGEQTIIPRGATELHFGDVLTLVGTTAAVQAGRTLLQGENA